MMKNIIEVDFKNIRNTIPSFITIIIMLLSYSITDGIGAGIISFTIIDIIIYVIELMKYNNGVLKEKPKPEITPLTLIIFILFIIYYFVPTVL